MGILLRRLVVRLSGSRRWLTTGARGTATVLALLVSLGATLVLVHPRFAFAATSITDSACTSASYAHDVAALATDPGADLALTFHCASAADIDIRGSSGGPDTVRLASGQSLSITSSGASVSLDGEDAEQIFNVGDHAALTLDALTITHGHVDGAGAAGGAILNRGTLTISNSAFTGNTATGPTGSGGAIAGGTASISYSTFSHNTADRGGAFYGITAGISYSTVSGNSASGVDGEGGAAYGGNLSIDSSTFADNSATSTSGSSSGPSGSGGAIFLGDSPESVSIGGSAFTSVSIDSSTFSGNTATGSGGGVYGGDLGGVVIGSSTFTGNTAIDMGGAVYITGAGTILFTTIAANTAGSVGGIASPGAMTILWVGESIVANNAGGNCSMGMLGSPVDLTFSHGFLDDAGYNLEDGSAASGDVTDCGFSGNVHDLLVADANAVGLGPLGDHGGPTQTMPLAATSPAVDAFPTNARSTLFVVFPTMCPANSPSGSAHCIGPEIIITSDFCEQGQSNDQRGASQPQGVACDIGAYELDGLDLSLAVDAPKSGSFVSGSTPLTVSATDTLGLGVASVSYCIYQGNVCAGDFTSVTGTSASFTLGTDRPDGSYTIAYFATHPGGAHGPTYTTTLTLDQTAPTITISSPTNNAVLDASGTLILGFDATDSGSGMSGGLASLGATLDGATSVANGQTMTLTSLSLGSHTLAVTATDALGNSGSQSVTFTVTVTAAGIASEVQQFFAAGQISNSGIEASLLAKLQAADAARSEGRCAAASNDYQAFINDLTAQSGKGIDPAAASALIGDAQYLMARCP